MVYTILDVGLIHIDLATFILLCIVTAAVIVIALTFAWDGIVGWLQRPIDAEERQQNRRLRESQRLEANAGTIVQALGTIGGPTDEEAEALSRASAHSVNSINEITGH